MANENQSEIRIINHGTSDRENDDRRTGRSTGDHATASEPTGSPTTSEPVQETDDERAARETQERETELARIDETEFVEDAQSTTLARRAFALFDPNDTEPQAAEHWVEIDQELEQFGNF